MATESCSIATSLLPRPSRLMFPPEFQLLLYCARSHPASRQIKQHVDDFAIDWGKLLALADQHCVRPLLLQSLKRCAGMLFHHRSGLSLKVFASPTRRKICFWRQSFCDCSGASTENEVPVVAFKGPILAEAVYGDLSLREFCDLDLLIRVTGPCQSRRHSAGLRVHGSVSRSRLPHRIFKLPWPIRVSTRTERSLG